MEELFGAISNFGFPIVMTVYLLVRFEGKLDSLKDSVGDLNDTIKDLKNELERFYK